MPSMRTFPGLVFCEHCDSIYRRLALSGHEKASCPKCATVLYRASRLNIDSWLALTIAAAILFVIANLCPIVRISMQDLHSEATLWQAARALAHGAAAPIAIPAAVAVIFAPFLQISLLGWVLLHARLGRRAPGFATAMRALSLLRPWSMTEVGLLGILVADIKLSSYLEVRPGAGVFAMAGLMVLLIFIASRDTHRLWQSIETEPPQQDDAILQARQTRVIGCHGCGLVCEETASNARCPRCGAPLHRRRPESLARGWAFLIAGIIFYIPANLLPVMYTSLFGNGSDSTIMRGVVEFWQSGSYGVALVIFTASVAVPCIKFLALGLLLSTARRQSRWAQRERTRLYRMVEIVGYWSMLDVLVVAVVTALVRFHGLSDTEPRAGIFFFGMVVIFTMLSAMSFDPRLIWDTGENEHCADVNARSR